MKTFVPKYSVTLPVDNALLGDPEINRILVSLMCQSATNNGAASHWGGPSAFAEIISVIHHFYFKENKSDDFNIVNDAGHAENGIYASLANYGFAGLSFDELLTFRSIKSRLTGHGEVAKFKEGVLVSNGPLGSAVAQAQGLAIADKFLGKKRKTVLLISDGACMEGEAKEGICAIPGLFAKNKLNPFLLIVSDNNTKLMGPTRDAFSMQPFFESLGPLGWQVLVEPNGNDLKSVYLQIKNALNLISSGPVAIIFKTVKGCRVKLTENLVNGGHGFPLGPYDEKLKQFILEIKKDIPSELLKLADQLMVKQPLPSNDGVKIQKGISNALIEAAKKGKPVFSITSDVASSTGLGEFQKAFPDKFVDVGIAESNMIGVATGMAKRGYIAVVDAFAQFGVTKGSLPLFMSTLSQGPIIAIFSHTGMQDAADGASHQSTNYISLTASIPKVKVITLATKEDGYKYLTMAIDYFYETFAKGEIPESVVFFLGRENFPSLLTNDYKWEEPQQLTTGDDLTLVTCGPTVHFALDVYNRLKMEGINITVINNCFVNNFEITKIKDSLQRTKKLLTVEDHQLYLGMGSLLVHRLKLENIEFKLSSLGLGSIGESAYSSNDLYKKYGIDSDSIYNEVRKLIG